MKEELRQVREGRSDGTSNETQEKEERGGNKGEREGTMYKVKKEGGGRREGLIREFEDEKGRGRRVNDNILET